MGLGRRSATFTEEGVKRLYQFFILNFGIILFQILLVIIVLLGAYSGYLSGLLYSIITSSVFVALIWIIDALILVWLFWSFTDMVLGRKEFDKQHEISVIIASALFIPSIFLYLFQLILSKGLVVSASAFYFNPTGYAGTILVQGQLLLAISIALPIMLGPALFLFIHKLSVTTEKVPLLVACVLLATSPFTINITALIAFILFFLIYKSVYLQLQHVGPRPTLTVPCPFCNRDIPIESKVCPYCGKKFEENLDIDVGLRISLDAPKQQSNLPNGYTPVKGPTEEEKKRLFLIIGIIVIVIIVVAALVCLLR